MSNRCRPHLTCLLALFALPALTARGDETKDAAHFPQFRMQEIDTDLKIGYAVLLVDLNADGKIDIVVADKTRVVWYENPTWKRRTIIDGKTQPDNVCIAAHDIDGDGQLDLALGAGWNPSDTLGGGTLQWLKRGKTLDEPWTVYAIDNEPTLHRIRFADLDGSGKPKLIVVPLFGKGSTGQKNHMDTPVRILAYSIPKDPARDRWEQDLLYQGLHVSHNFFPVPSVTGKGMDILTASYEGIGRIGTPVNQREWKALATGNQDNPNGSRGASEIKQGTLKNGQPYIATIEPWHGNQVVVYPLHKSGELLERHIIDDRLKWGHGVWCADLDGDGDEELIIGVRDDLSQKPGERRGVRLYKAIDGSGTKWARHILDPGGVAVEDIAAADLDGDGRLDIVAVGRQTHNVRIYWNQGNKNGPK